MSNWKTAEGDCADKDPRWVCVVAHIRKNETGEVRRYDTEELLEEGDKHPSVFNWEENNFSCDCNRELFFERAARHEIDIDVTKCSDGRYSVNLENPATGEVYYREFGSEAEDIKKMNDEFVAKIVALPDDHPFVKLAQENMRARLRAIP